MARQGSGGKERRGSGEKAKDEGKQTGSKRKVFREILIGKRSGRRLDFCMRGKISKTMLIYS